MADARAGVHTIQTSSEVETAEWGTRLGARVERGLTICLVGALGSGKSVLARGICKGLGVDDDVVSPSFILFEEYQGRLPVLHGDLYRLDHESEIENLGLFDRLGDAVVILVEWGDRSPTLMRHADVVIELTVTGPSGRRLVVRADPVLSSLFGE